MGNGSFADTLTDDQIRAIAAVGWQFGYAMIESYKAMYKQAIDSSDPAYVGGFGVFRHYPEPFTPDNKDIVTPNNDTPYSWAWLDLRAEPYVITVPEIDRYYLLPIHDMYTLYAGYVGTRSRGGAAGNYLVAGPRWSGETADSIDGVIRSETDFVGMLGRTYCAGGSDVETVRQITSNYLLRPLSGYLNGSAPAAAAEIDWPAFDDDFAKTGAGFFEYLDFLLQFAPPIAEEEGLREDLLRLGVGTGNFRAAALSDEFRAALEAGISEGQTQLEVRAGETLSATGLFGTREELGTDYGARNVGANMGIYGLPFSEAWYGGWLGNLEADAPQDGNRYSVRFDADKLPPADVFWSATMYGLPDRLLVANPINRYSIGDRTEGLVYGEDGSITLYLQPDPPSADKAANWLPTPHGPWGAALRLYGPRASVLDGSWVLPELRME